jgi:protocatechuate 3,4-dioxygenase, alpha subunit
MMPPSMPASQPESGAASAAQTMSVSIGSQTIGPFFHIGLDYLWSDAQSRSQLAADEFEVRGRILDADGRGISDAMLEFWGANASGVYDSAPAVEPKPRGFVRAGTGPDGEFHIVMRVPGPAAFSEERMQAPHVVVLVFMRGLLRHLITRLYLPDEARNGADPVLSLVPLERRETLIARKSSRGARSFDWDIHMQGEGETVFFAW